MSDNLDVRPEKLALMDRDRSVTYLELSDEVDRIAGFIADSGIRRGDRVGVHLRKGIPEVVAMLAVWKIGAVVVNINFQWKLDQLEYVANDCQIGLLFVEERCAMRMLRRGVPQSLKRVIVHGEVENDGTFCSWHQALGGVGRPPERQLESDLGLIIYTSGSTGQPKGVMLSHANVLAGARSVARYLDLQESDRLISVPPYSFDYGLNQLTTMLLVGGTVVHQPASMATDIVNTLRDFEITGFAAVPPTWCQVVRLLAEVPMDFPHLRRITNTGGKIPANILEQMPAVFPGADIYLMYGLTEAFRSTYLNPQKFEEKMGSIGQAIPNAEVYVVKHGKGLAAAGEKGELVHRGPLVSLGYWGNADATASKIRPCPELQAIIGDEPVVYSGDIVEIDEDGDIWFVGRDDSMIKCSGFRVSPDEVEDLISTSGFVGDAVAFGVEDDDLGQVVHVAVSPLDGYNEALVLAHCRKVMPNYMVPRRLHAWSEQMPRTASGKLAKPDVIRITRQSEGLDQSNDSKAGKTL
jgi:acyl-CoA ligase (AMP-forming) (exosortase A-associated)